MDTARKDRMLYSLCCTHLPCPKPCKELELEGPADGLKVMLLDSYMAHCGWESPTQRLKTHTRGVCVYVCVRVCSQNP